MRATVTVTDKTRFASSSQGILKLMRSGSFHDQPIRYLEIIGLTAPPRELRADGRGLKFTFDAESKRLNANLLEGVSEITLVK